MALLKKRKKKKTLLLVEIHGNLNSHPLLQGFRLSPLDNITTTKHNEQFLKISIL
jgi:hypothetical protein